MTQLSPSANAYLMNKVLSASPEELRLMLLDGAIRFVRQGREGLANKNYEASFNGFSQARNIVMELINSIRPEYNPELCSKVSGVYTFLYTQLIEAGHERNIAKIDKVIQLLEYERETWILLMEKLAAEKLEATKATATVSAMMPQSSESRPAFSVSA
jgi:flagellar protein FliS